MTTTRDWETYDREWPERAATAEKWLSELRTEIAERVGLLWDGPVVRRDLPTERRWPDRLVYSVAASVGLTLPDENLVFAAERLLNDLEADGLLRGLHGKPKP